jgi:hypothetical protein
MSKTWDTTPKTHMLLGLANQRWHAQGAVSELVDNSFGALRGDARNVWLTFERQRNHLRKLIVLDDGIGMDHIGKLFQLGETIGMGPGDIGKYGMGGTMAILWLSEFVSIWSLQNGKVMHDRIRWEDHIGQPTFPQVNDAWETATLVNTPAALFELGHGTLIELRLRDTRRFEPELVQRELARLYAPGLRRGKSITWTSISGKRTQTLELRGEPFDLPDDPSKIIHFNLKVKMQSEVLPVEGTVALVDDLPYARSYISIGLGHRVVMTTRDCYQSSDDEKRYSGVGVGGWLDLGQGWQNYLSTTKDEIHDESLRVALMDHVFKKIEPLLKQTEQEQLSIVLEGIALELAHALHGLQEHDLDIDAKTDVMPAIILHDVSINPEIKPIIEPIITDAKIVEPADDPGDKESGKQPPAYTISLQPSDDAAMGGTLCRMQIASDNESNLRIEINQDHQVVDELLKARPLNRMGLNLMVTREIAAALIGRPAIMKRTLSSKMLRKLETMADDQPQQERLLARMLMDCARRPKLIDEAA